MSRPPVHKSYYYHHLFQLTPLINVNFAVDNFAFFGIGILDSGCTAYIVAIQRSKEVHSNIRISEIEGSVPILGELICNITYIQRHVDTGYNFNDSDS